MSSNLNIQMFFYAVIGYFSLANQSLTKIQTEFLDRKLRLAERKYELARILWLVKKLFYPDFPYCDLDTF